MINTRFTQKRDLDLEHLHDPNWENSPRAQSSAAFENGGEEERGCPAAELSLWVLFALRSTNNWEFLPLWVQFSACEEILQELDIKNWISVMLAGGFQSPPSTSTYHPGQEGQRKASFSPSVQARYENLHSIPRDAKHGTFPESNTELHPKWQTTPLRLLLRQSRLLRYLGVTPHPAFPIRHTCVQDPCWI